MKNWEEIIGKKYVYLANEVTTTNDDEIEIVAPQFQKCEVQYIEENEILLIVYKGKHDGEELYYYTDRDKASELLTEEEYKMINISEVKVWNELKQIVKSIEALKETPTDNLKFVYHAIKDRIK